MSGTFTQFPVGSTQYKINFDYLARAFVVVTLVKSSDSSQNKVLTVGNDYRFLNPTTLELLASQTGFDLVQIHRETSTGLIVEFRDGSVLTSSDLTNAELQAIHIAEEGRDQTIERGRQYADAAEKAAQQGEVWYNATRDLLIVNGVDSTLRTDLNGPNGYQLIPSVPSRTEFNQLAATISSSTFQNAKSSAELKHHLQASGNINVITFGDSTFYGATPGDLATPSFWNPPATLVRTINLLYGVTPHLKNWAISGTTLRGCITGDDQGNPAGGLTMEQRLISAMAEAPTLPAVVYCNHGINDSQLNLSIDQFRLDVITFINTCRKNGATPIYVTPNSNTPYAIIDYPKEKRLHSFVKVIRDVCAAMGVDVVDNFYYFMQTLKYVPATTLIPDGAHPSHWGYRMAGQNMAIPLVNAHTLSKVGDRAPITGTTVFDNIRKSRNLQYQVDNTFGMSLSGELDTVGPQGFNYPVILDEPTNDTFVAFHGIRWPSGCTGVLSYNGVPSTMYSGNLTNYSPTDLQWDSMFVPDSCKLYAGLHVIGALWSSPAAAGEGNGFGVSGLSLQKRRYVASAMFKNDNTQTLGNNCMLTTTVEIMPGGNFSLIHARSGAAIMNISLAATGGALNLDYQGQAFPLGTGITGGTYPVIIQIKDKVVSVSLGTINKDITLPNVPPEMIPAQRILMYAVQRTRTESSWVDVGNAAN